MVLLLHLIVLLLSILGLFHSCSSDFVCVVGRIIAGGSDHGQTKRRPFARDTNRILVLFFHRDGSAVPQHVKKHQGGKMIASHTLAIAIPQTTATQRPRCPLFRQGPQLSFLPHPRPFLPPPPTPSLFAFCKCSCCTPTAKVVERAVLDRLRNSGLNCGSLANSACTLVRYTSRRCS